MRPILSLMLLASLLAAQGHVHTDRAGAKLLPLTTEDGVWHFAVYGDRTGGPAEGIEVLAQAVKDTNLLDPDLVMTVGDLIQGYNTTPQWMEQMREYHEVMGGLKMPWYPVAGNHDVYWRGPKSPLHQHEQNYEKHFGPLWYHFSHKTAGFVVLYSDEGDRKTGEKNYHKAQTNLFSEEQLRWLQGALAALKDRRHVFVFVHHPKWQPGRYPGNNWARVHGLLKAAGNVSAVFGGHIHRMTYSGVRDGIEYLTLATVGGGLRMEVPQAGFLHHVNIVTVRDGGISMATLPVGGVLDPRSFTPERLEDLDRLMASSRPKMASPLRIDRAGRSRGEVVLSLTNPSKHPIEATLLLDGDASWKLGPDHLHQKIAPGATARLRFAALREGGALGGLALPRVRTRIDVLHPEARIALPETELEVEARIEIPRNDGEIAAGVLDLSRRSCLRVAPEQLRLPQGPFTVEGWMKARRLRGRRPFLAKTQSSEFSIFVNGGVPSFSVHLDGKYIDAKADTALLKTDRWHHLAGVFDGEQVRLYVDGKLAASAPARGKRTLNDLPFFVGADPDGRGAPVDHLDGQIDLVRVSSVARYTEDFQPQRAHGSDRHTRLLLPLDTGYGPYHPDRSGREAHAKALGQPRIVPLGRDSSRGE